MIKLVLSDIDDTLVSFGLPHATPKALSAIHALQAAGVHFSVASGRMPWDLGWLFAGDTAASETCVCCNGQIVILDGKLLLMKELDHEGLCQVVEVLADEPGASLILTEQGRRYVVGPLASDDPGKKYSRGGDSWQTPQQVDEVPDRPWIKANVPVADPADMARLRARLREAVPQLDFVSPNPRGSLIDISPRGWGKADGANILRQALGVEMDEVAVFGDAENDLELINWAPRSVAVANADPVVAAAARYHIGASKDDAVADALLDISRATPMGKLPEFMSDYE